MEDFFSKDLPENQSILNCQDFSTEASISIATEV